MTRPAIDGLPTFTLIDRLSVSEVEPGSMAPQPVRDSTVSTGTTGTLVYRHTTKVQQREAVRRYKDLVKRDLEWLFNTRRTFDDRIELFPNLAASVYAYGLPDISSMNVGSTKDQAMLLRIMERSLRVFDQRLKDVQIEFEPSANGSRSLQFKINGLLVMDPAPEEILIDTVLDSDNDKFEVK